MSLCAAAGVLAVAGAAHAQQADAKARRENLPGLRRCHAIDGKSNESVPRSRAYSGARRASATISATRPR
jgi:hypothetical protein